MHPTCVSSSRSETGFHRSFRAHLIGVCFAPTEQSVELPDLRLTKTFGLPSKTELRLIGEVFNMFNVSNVTNFNYNLVVPATFGKANQRVGQTFGSGGPRAFQIAARFSF